MQYSLQEIADFLDAKLDAANAEVNTVVIDGLGTLENATATQIAFFHNPKPQYLEQLATCAAGVVLVAADYGHIVSGAKILVADPYAAYARVSALFVAPKATSQMVAASAVIPKSCILGSKVIIESNVVLGENCHIDDGSFVGANTVLGADCYIGKNSCLEANVTFYNDVRVGERCRIHSGAVIGADGFGYAPSQGQWLKIHQLGGVRIGDDVEIGAGTTVDRGAIEHTRIGHGVIIDNQVQVAHNVIIGTGTAIAGCTAIAGSTKIGSHCTIAGACGITGHLDIAAGSHITAMSLVSKSIHQSGAYSSSMSAQENNKWQRNVVRFRQLDKLAGKIKKLEIEFKQYKAKVSPNDGCE